MKFSKMQALGNDFVVIESITQQVDMNATKAAHIANRHYGVGCDQVLLIGNVEGSRDFTYRIFNADGSEVFQCGNGARCVGRYLQKQGLIEGTTATLQTRNNRLHVEVLGDDTAVTLQAPSFQEALRVSIDDDVLDFHVVDVGNPHAVAIVSSLEDVAFEQWANALQAQHHFKEGVNVGFLAIMDRSRAALCVIERGVGFTRACGSGAVAAHAVGYANQHLDEKALISQAGGDLRLQWAGDKNPVLMIGEAAHIFDGVWLL